MGQLGGFEKKPKYLSDPRPPQNSKHWYGEMLGLAGEVAEVRLRAVLFDWDGTLLDSAEACRRSYERLFGSFGIAFDRALFDASYSPDWYRTYEKVGLPREKWSEADAAWLEIYAAEECGLVAGAREALALLAPESLSSGLVTSGTAERVRREISRLGLAFDAVVCTEEVGRRKPDPAALHLGLERLGVAPREAAYVGDSPEDIEMARAAGVYSVAIPGPFPNREQLRAAGPDLFSEDLLSAVRALLGAGRSA